MTIDTCKFLVEKVKNRLNGYEVSLLSLAGPVTLAKSVLLVVPSYCMQSTLLRVGVCREIERLVRRFIWGSTTAK